MFHSAGRTLFDESRGDDSASPTRRNSRTDMMECRRAAIASWDERSDFAEGGMRDGSTERRADGSKMLLEELVMTVQGRKG